MATLLVSSLSAANPPLEVQISNETGPPGGWVQIKLSLTVPQSVGSGGIELKLDPTVFGRPLSAAVFSTNGDGWGTWIPEIANLRVTFSCGRPCIGLGKARNLPMLVITVPILSSAVPGTVVVLSADGLLSDLNLGKQLRRSPWFDPNGTPFDVSLKSGSLTVGGSLSIQSVAPGGGGLPAGTSVRINGTGFTPDTSVDIDGVSVASTTLIGPQAIDVTLGGPTDLTAKRVVMRNAAGSQAEFFSFLPSPSFAVSYGLQALFPPLPTSVLRFFPRGVYPADITVQNPNLEPAELTIEQAAELGRPAVKNTAIVPGDGSWRFSVPEYCCSGMITSSQPVRAMGSRGTYLSPSLAPYFPSSGPPFIGAIVNGGSLIQGSIAPGEIIAVYGTGVGSLNAVGLTLDSSGVVQTNAGGIQILFDGKPAPILYSSLDQTNVVVPYEVSNQSATVIEVISNGRKSAAWAVPIAHSSPAIFSLGGNGIGQAAVLNQDNSINSPSNPAALGTVIQIFATGEGQTSPPGATGSITRFNIKKPLLPVQATIDGLDAPVQFAGSAPESVAGLLQVNAVVPQGVRPSGSVPISLTIGGKGSAGGVTVAVK